MHIAIFVYGTWGDIRPHVVLGTALQKAGHEVQVVASPGYEQWVRDRGLGFYRLTTDVNTFARDNAKLMDAGFLLQLQTLRTHIAPLFTQMGLEVMGATRHADVLMTVEFGISLLLDVVKANKLKPIFVNPAPLNPTRESNNVLPNKPGWFPFEGWYNRLGYTVLRQSGWRGLAGGRNSLAKQLGLPTGSYKDFRAVVDTAPALTTVSRHVFQRPSDWGDHWQVTGFLFDDEPEWSPPPELVDFLAAGEAPVYVGFGSMPDANPAATTRTILDAVWRAGKRAIILTGWAGLGADDVPENVYILKYASHSWLFPRMSAVVHHGGSGTTASGLRAGVPTVVVPHQGDQGFWGRRVKDLGVGTVPIPRKKLTADNLTAAIKEATTNRTLLANARALGEKIQQEDGLAEAVKWVERFLS
ncbi:MAG: glycosyltransferase [Anaerolineae bacterium]|nr:glycosyltransferase [Anaerolineae bacterium]